MRYISDENGYILGYTKDFDANSKAYGFENKAETNAVKYRYGVLESVSDRSIAIRTEDDRLLYYPFSMTKYAVVTKRGGAFTYPKNTLMGKLQTGETRYALVRYENSVIEMLVLYED